MNTRCFRRLSLLGLGAAVLLGHAAVAADAAGKTAAGSSAKPEFINSGKVVPTTLPFSEAVRAGNTLYLSGQVGLAPGTLKLVPGGLKEEARQTLDNIKTSLEAHGAALSDVVKCTVFLADLAEWGAFNDIYKTYFAAGHYPARSALGANGLAFNARVEVECIAVIQP